ncbi:hypothetical protein Q6268_29605, partial [Klebsiella pneumoniae]|uniref:hypothetical protein n=1 Tax=Klebsiella pneumoniae TaxID=573 RepID=UPI002730B388
RCEALSILRDTVGCGCIEEVITLIIKFQTNNEFPLLTVADELVLDFLNVSDVCRLLKFPLSSFMMDV